MQNSPDCSSGRYSIPSQILRLQDIQSHSPACVDGPGGASQWCLWHVMAKAGSPVRQRKAAAHTSQESPQENKHRGD